MGRLLAICPILCQNKCMTTDKIKQKIEILLNKYQKNSGTIKGFDMLFEYVDFIKNEPYNVLSKIENKDDFNSVRRGRDFRPRSAPILYFSSILANNIEFKY